MRLVSKFNRRKSSSCLSNRQVGVIDSRASSSVTSDERQARLSRRQMMSGLAGAAMLGVIPAADAASCDSDTRVGGLKGAGPVMIAVRTLSNGVEVLLDRAGLDAQLSSPGARALLEIEFTDLTAKEAARASLLIFLGAFETATPSDPAYIQTVSLFTFTEGGTGRPRIVVDVETTLRNLTLVASRLDAFLEQPSIAILAQPHDPEKSLQNWDIDVTDAVLLLEPYS